MKTFLLNVAIVPVLFAGASTPRQKSLRALVSEEGKQANLDVEGSLSLPLSAEGGEEALGFGDLNLGLGDNSGNNGWKPDGWKPDGWLGDLTFDIHKTMVKMEHNGFDVEKACEEIYPTSTGPTCDCKAETPATLRNLQDWGSAGDPDFCNATDWSYDFCLQTGADIEATRGNITLTPPSACADTGDKIVCEIEKFRMAPPFPVLSGSSGISVDSVYFVAAGLTMYQGAKHSCAVIYGTADSADPIFGFLLQPSYTDLTNDWIYETDSIFKLDYYRSFRTVNETDMAANPPLDLAQCGVYEPIAPTQ